MYQNLIIESFGGVRRGGTEDNETDIGLFLGSQEPGRGTI